MNNFMNVLGVIFVAMSALTAWQTIKRRKMLGELKQLTLGGFKYTDKSQILLVFLCIVLWAWSIMSDTEYALGSMFTYAFLSAMVILMISNLIQLTVKPGFYKEGLATGSSTLLYNEVKSYEVIEDKKNSDIVYIYFNGGAKLFSSVRVVIPKENLAEVKKMLKKECTFK